jgi:hypothetical protein
LTEINIGERGIKPYIPSFVAMSKPYGIVNPELATPLSSGPGVFFANGIKPGSCNGGLIKIGEELWGVDHVAVEQLDDGNFAFSGTDKSSIEVYNPESNTGTVRNVGALIMTNIAKREISIAALAVPDTDNNGKLKMIRSSSITNFPGIYKAIPKRLGIVGTEGAALIGYATL